MNIAVVGAGAMGSLFGALLAEAGQEVWLVDVWADHVNAIQNAGLGVEREGLVRLVQLNATTDPAGLDSCELVIVFVKSIHTSEAAKTAAKLADAGMPDFARP